MSLLSWSNKMCDIGKATSIIKLTDGKSNHLFFWIRRDFHPIDNRSNGIEGCSGREWSWDVPSSSLCRWHDFFLSERNQWFSCQCRVFFFFYATHSLSYHKHTRIYQHIYNLFSRAFKILYIFYIFRLLHKLCRWSIRKGFIKCPKPVHVDQT